MKEIKEKINEMTNELNRLIDQSVEYFPNAQVNEHFPAESVDYIEIKGKIYKVKMVITVTEA